MAQKVRIILEDDLDGGPADETIRLAWTALTTKLGSVLLQERSSPGDAIRPS